MTLRQFFSLGACGAALLVLTLLALQLQHLDDLSGFLGLAGLQVIIYFAAVWLAASAGSGRAILLLILLFAAAMRVAVLLSPAYLSSDIYRYIWDGRVTAAGINPYRYIPTDSHLAELRDPTIFPEINRSNYAPTIYPPAAQAVFLAASEIGGTITAMKAVMVGFEAIAMIVMARLLTSSGHPLTRLLIYAWHPLPIWEFAGSGHIDAAMIAFLMLALWARGRVPQSPKEASVTGLALAAATLIKFYPAVLALALYQRWDRALPTVFAVVIVLAYLPFLGAGWHVFGFLHGYAAEEGFASGSGFYFLGLLRLVAPSFPAWLYAAFAFAVMAGIALVLMFGHRRTDPDAFIVGCAVLATAFTMLLSPHYPWYFAWLLVFACLLPGRALVWLTAASLLLYLVPVGSSFIRDGYRLLVESVIYVPFAILAVIDWRARRSLNCARLEDG